MKRQKEERSLIGKGNNSMLQTQQWQGVWIVLENERKYFFLIYGRLFNIRI